MQGGFLRFVLIAGIGLLAYQFLLGGDGGETSVQPIQQEVPLTPTTRAAYQYCTVETPYFRAQLTTRGAALRHFELLKPKYVKGGVPIDLSSTPHPGVPVGSPLAEDPSAGGEHEFRQQLFSQWRNPTVDAPDEVDWNVDFDSVDYRLESSDSQGCEFSYADSKVEIRKWVRATDRPYELEIEHRIKNLDSAARRHAFAIDTVAWRLSEEVAGQMFRVSPYVTSVECVPEVGDALRLLPDAFEPGDFSDDESFSVRRPWGWYQSGDKPDVAAVSNAYFTHGVAPLDGQGEPVCQLLVENRFVDGDSSHAASGSYYRARVAHPLTSLAPGESSRYLSLAYVGPKERVVLAAAGGGEHRFLELIDLGFFSWIAKVLVAFLLKVHSVVPSWGLAIIVLTVTARMLLFPLSLPSIRNMVRMRELKPEMEALNQKHKNDPQAKGLAQMELWRKHKVNPLKGCLPQLASMPVWFALYTTLQTAVELYNIPFLWFPDLSERDPYFVLPVVIGATFFLQQKLMPMQGGDPAQQKMMMYFMPGMFTVFMLFLPSGLGVYMFTNSLLAIGQQQAVEWQVRRASARARLSDKPTSPLTKER